ncbi:MAG TPA: hypothetical protein VFA63_00645, partial [Pseudonocardiaceae bacterium]|nr:hypothetical protein [Pseudonocardiaceae bacterium]
MAFVSPPEFWPLVGWDTAAFACLLGLWTTICAAAQRFGDQPGARIQEDGPLRTLEEAFAL